MPSLYTMVGIPFLYTSLGTPPWVHPWVYHPSTRLPVLRVWYGCTAGRALGSVRLSDRCQNCQFYTFLWKVWRLVCLFALGCSALPGRINERLDRRRVS